MRHCHAIYTRAPLQKGDEKHARPYALSSSPFLVGTVSFAQSSPQLTYHLPQLLVLDKRLTNHFPFFPLS